MHISFIKRKVHYLYLILAIVSMVLGVVSYARAQEPTGSMQAAAQNANTARSTSLTTEQRDRFINLIRNVYTRMEGAAARLENIAARLDERIVKLEAEGVDTSEALPPFNQAKERLSTIKAALEGAKASAETGILSDTPRERFKTARTQFHTITEALRETFLLLRQTNTALKDAVMEANLNNNGVSDAVKAVDPVSTDVTN